MFVKSIFQTETVHPEYGKLLPDALLEINDKDYTEDLFEPVLQVQCLAPKCGFVYLFDWSSDGGFLAKPCPECGSSTVEFVRDKVLAKPMIPVQQLAPDKMLVFDTWMGAQDRGFGDILLTTPAIKKFKEKNPEIKIIYLASTQNTEVLQGNPYVDRVIGSEQIKTIEPSAKRFFLEKKLEDYKIPRNRYCHRVDSIAELLGVYVNDKSLVYKVTPQEERWAQDILGRGNKKKVGIVLKTTSPIRDWPFEYSLELAQKLSGDYTVVVLEKRYYPEFNKFLNLTGKTSLRQLAAVISQLHLLVTPDTGALHFAGALNVPTIALFGVLPSELRTAYYPNCISLRSNTCEPCCYDWQFKTCKLKDGYSPCLWDISPEKVFEVVKMAMEGQGCRRDTKAISISHPSETSLCRDRLSKYCQGDGLDLGFGGDPIVPSAITVDLPQPYTSVGSAPQNLHGDATDLRWFKDGTLDYLFASHLLEDFTDTETILREWLRVIKPSGYLILYCPDEQVYSNHCKQTGQPYNLAHKIKDFSLKYVRGILEKIGGVEIIHENSLVETYSFELVAKKK